MARAARKFFKYIIAIFHDFSWEILCVDKVGSRPPGFLCVDKIGSRPPGFLWVDKIGSWARSYFLFENQVMVHFQISKTPPMHLAAHSLLENRPMIAFSKGSGLCSGSGIGSPDIFRHPARPGPGEAALPSAAEHAPTPTHSRIRTHVDTSRRPRFNFISTLRKKISC